ncbi:MAG: xanthine dehydrogenase family protein subunit M [Ideonella sp.]|nr:xanthine dehydrogenase family protein subunit M [Ideonella sp.]
MSAAFDTVVRTLAATRLQQALAALAQPGGATVLAGGTDLMPQGQAGRLRPAATLLNICRVEGLGELQARDGRLAIGALVSVTTLLEHTLVRQHAPLLSQVAARFASEQIRNAATVGGNLCNASPAGDLLTPLLALDAEVDLARLADDGSTLTRTLPLTDFFVGPGRTARTPHELLTAVHLPLAPPEQVVRYYKGGTRQALDISSISIALAARRGGYGVLTRVRLALGGVGRRRRCAHSAEAQLEGRRLEPALVRAAAAAAAADARPIDDVRASAWYRRELLRNMTKRMLSDVAEH